MGLGDPGDSWVQTAQYVRVGRSVGVRFLSSSNTRLKGRDLVLVESTGVNNRWAQLLGADGDPTKSW